LSVLPDAIAGGLDRRIQKCHSSQHVRDRDQRYLPRNWAARSP
jgi:hypothetical protein